MAMADRTRRARHLRDDERGMMLIFAGLGIIAFMSASMLAIDVGMIMVARTQAQRAADSGALAGAMALYYDNWEDRSATGPAVQNAIKAATAAANEVMGAAGSVQPGDVTFPAINQVRVEVQRTAARGNPLMPFIATMFGIDEVDMGAVATAEASPATAMTCVKPFTIPDKWNERQDPEFNPRTSSFDIADAKGNPIPNPDVYVPPGPGYTGYDPWLDRGKTVVIKADNDSKLYPSFYNPYAMGGETGAEEYRWNIANCNQTLMRPGESLVAEPGFMSGPTKQGVSDLIALDPTADWNDGLKKVVSNRHPSPRVVTIPVFNPQTYYQGKMNGRTADLVVTNFIGIFVEEIVGDEIIGRITPVPGLLTGGGPTPTNAFPAAIVLVK
jgi:hypothetical protein